MSKHGSENPSVPLALRPFVQRWALAEESARMSARRAASPSELMAFYDAIVAEFDGLIERIGNRKVEDLSEEDRVVLDLLLSGVEVSQMVEVFGANGMGPEVFPEERFESLM
jgi:hypothetical protein